MLTDYLDTFWTTGNVPWQLYLYFAFAVPLAFALVTTATFAVADQFQVHKLSSDSWLKYAMFFLVSLIVGFASAASSALGMYVVRNITELILQALGAKFIVLAVLFLAAFSAVGVAQFSVVGQTLRLQDKVRSDHPAIPKWKYLGGLSGMLTWTMRSEFDNAFILGKRHKRLATEIVAAVGAQAPSALVDAFIKWDRLGWSPATRSARKRSLEMAAIAHPLSPERSTMHVMSAILNCGGAAFLSRRSIAQFIEQRRP